MSAVPDVKEDEKWLTAAEKAAMNLLGRNPYGARLEETRRAIYNAIREVVLEKASTLSDNVKAQPDWKESAEDAAAFMSLNNMLTEGNFEAAVSRIYSAISWTHLGEKEAGADSVEAQKEGLGEKDATAESVESQGQNELHAKLAKHGVFKQDLEEVARNILGMLGAGYGIGMQTPGNRHFIVTSILEAFQSLEEKEAVTRNTAVLKIARLREALKHYARRYDKDGKCWNWKDYVCDSYTGEVSHFDWHGDEQENPWEIAEKVLSEADGQPEGASGASPVGPPDGVNNSTWIDPTELDPAPSPLLDSGEQRQ